MATWSSSHPKGVRLSALLLLTAAGALVVTTLGDKAGGRDSGRIVDLELAGASADHLQWIEDALQADFFFILAYVVLLALAAWVASPLFRIGMLRDKGWLVAGGAAVLAGVCDVVENLFLLSGLHDDGDSASLFEAAAVFAISKFVLLFGVLLFVLAALWSGLVTPAWLYRRIDAAPPLTGEPAERRFEPGYGIALSGGGIRAASLSLGVLQELERPDPSFGRELVGREGSGRLGWANAKKITAVSGGAYMAGAWLHSREPHAPPEPSVGRTPCPDAWRHPTDGSNEPSVEERYLLENLGYLASTRPRGGFDQAGGPKRGPRDRVADRQRSGASVWATVFVGFAVNLLVLATSLILLVVPTVIALDWLVRLPYDGCHLHTEIDCVRTQPRFWVPPLFWLSVAALTSVLWVLVTKRFGFGVGPVERLANTRVGRWVHVWVLRTLKGITRGSLALAAVLAILLVAFPSLIALVEGWEWETGVATLTALAGTVGAVVRLVRKKAASLAPKLGGVAFGIFVVVAASWLAVVVLDRLHPRPGSPGLVRPRIGVDSDWWDATPFLDLPPSLSGSDEVWLLLLVAAVVLVLAYLMGSELWSLFAFYRGKIRLAFAVRRNTDGKAEPYVNESDASDPDENNPGSHPDGYLKEPVLSEFPASKLTICAASHATTRGVRTHHGIPAMSFTFSPDKVGVYVPNAKQGSWDPIERPMETFEEAYRGSGGSTSRRITPMFAVALSGAAVAPAMGRLRMGPTSMLITFANVRLGAWLPNPRYLSTADEVAEGSEQPKFPRVRLGYLFKEFLGIHDPSDAYVYVSDGGHWENTALVELLRTAMPREVFCVDADAGEAITVRQLAKAIDLAKLECDVDIFIDLEPMRAVAEEVGGPVFAHRSVSVGLMRRGADWGLLWHCKPALCRSSPAPLLAHREIDPQFPYTSTVDQFFDTATYVAYRDLGRHNAAEIRKARQRLGEFLAGKDAQQAQAADEEEMDDVGWVASAFVHLLHQVPLDQRDAVVAAVKSALPSLAATS